MALHKAKITLVPSLGNVGTRRSPTAKPAVKNRDVKTGCFTAVLFEVGNGYR